jgi:hypothetical protein
MGYQFTRPDTNQVKFTSSKTGDWLLEDYLQAAEHGNRTLATLLLDLFNPDGTLRVLATPAQVTAALNAAIEAEASRAAAAASAIQAANSASSLGLTTTGSAVLTAVNAAAARAAISALAAGDNVGSADATTQAAKDSTTKVATTAFVDRLLGLLTSATSGTLVLSDRGCRVPLTAGITVPSAVFGTNDVVTLDNTTGASITITQGSGLTLRTAGGTTTGNFTLAAHGLATMVFRSPTEAVISGNAG